MTWYSGRGKNGTQDRYVIRRYNIQGWINRTGSLSMPASEVKRIKNKNVLFYDLQTGERWITPASNFKNAEPVDGQVAVDIEYFDFFYRED